MTRCRQKTEDGGLVPLLANSVEDIEGVTALVLCILAAKIYCSEDKKGGCSSSGLVSRSERNNSNSDHGSYVCLDLAMLLLCPILARDN